MLSSTPEAISVYEAYPRRVAKPIALRAILKAINVFGYEHVLKRTQEFAERCNGRDLSFVPYPATFFNQERFNDDYDAMFPPVNGSKSTIIEIQVLIKAKEKYRDELRHKFSNEGPFGRTWMNDQKRLESKILSQEIKTLTQKLANYAERL